MTTTEQPTAAHDCDRERNVTVAQRVLRVVAELERRVGAGMDRDLLTAAVEADFHRYDSARIKEFVPVLVEREVRAYVLQLRTQGGDRG